ncbi:hypothetical protein SLT36_24180 [Aminobacter sp. BA135]|uniref:hypothetical protein n=1 Tax=Aminobacter sp. BA135 TaxID=537596 RepID=UPI003D7B873D
MADELVDRIYEAAFVPEVWSSALEAMIAASGPASGGMLMFDGENRHRKPLRSRQSPNREPLRCHRATAEQLS